MVNPASNTYLNSAGKKVKLATQIGKGGAGTIYKIASRPNDVAKVFFRPTKQDGLRIKEMVNDFKKGLIKLDLKWDKEPPTKIGTWPTEILYNSKGNFKGYIMPKAKGIELQYITSNNFSKHPEYKPFGKIRNKLILCQRLAIIFSNFYKSGNYTNGDIKPQNIYVNPKGFPMILDLDNLTIKNLSPKSKQGTPGYMAHDYKDDIYTDYFSIAVIFYELIFGIHPYVGSAKNEKIIETQDKIKNRMFVHGRKKRNFHVIPPPHQAFKTVLNKELQTLFHQAFDLDNSSKRPTMEQWASALKNFILSKSVFPKTYQANTTLNSKKLKVRRKFSRRIKKNKIIRKIQQKINPNKKRSSTKNKAKIKNNPSAPLTKSSLDIFTSLFVFIILLIDIYTSSEPDTLIMSISILCFVFYWPLRKIYTVKNYFLRNSLAVFRIIIIVIIAWGLLFQACNFVYNSVTENNFQLNEEIIKKCGCFSIDDCIEKNNIDCAWEILNSDELFFDLKDKFKIIKAESKNYIEVEEYNEGWDNLLKYDLEYYQNELIAFKYEYLNMVIDEFIEKGDLENAKVHAMKASDEHNIEGWEEYETYDWDDNKTQRKILLKKVEEFR